MTAVTKRILLAEDDRFLRRACEASLRQRGFEILTAADGQEALRLAQAESPDLILLDLLMPKVSGVEVLRTLKAADETKAIPVVIVTNSSGELAREDALKMGAAAYLVKANLSLQELGDRVAALLRG